MSPAVWFDWSNCNGEYIFRITAESPPWKREEYEIFLSDKEFVARLFDYLIPVCGVNNPLQNIKWLKEYCESIKEKQDISSVRINIYKSKDGHVFKILTGFPYEYAPNHWAECYSEVWKNCAGEELEFSKDLVYITEIFKFVKQ